MNAGLLRPDRIEASDKASWRVAATDSCPVSFSAVVVKRLNLVRSHVGA
jgi:hypothetical protein